MNIYSSLKVLPYVYKGINKNTGKIYIGSRVVNKISSDKDFGNIYKTSSKHVKPIFDEFEWNIVAEFFDPKDAYDFEQQMIHEQWLVSKEMSLNGMCYYNKISFNSIGLSWKLSEDTKRNMSKPKSENHKKKLKIPKSVEHKKKIGDSHRGRRESDQAKRNMSKIIDVLTPDGFVIENITMKELCSQFNLNYNSIKTIFGRNKSYKGFMQIK